LGCSTEICHQTLQPQPSPAYLRREEIRLETQEDVTLLTKIGEWKTEKLGSSGFLRTQFDNKGV